MGEGIEIFKIRAGMWMGSRQMLALLTVVQISIASGLIRRKLLDRVGRFSPFYFPNYLLWPPSAYPWSTSLYPSAPSSARNTPISVASSSVSTNQTRSTSSPKTSSSSSPRPQGNTILDARATASKSTEKSKAKEETKPHADRASGHHKGYHGDACRYRQHQLFRSALEPGGGTMTCYDAWTTAMVLIADIGHSLHHVFQWLFVSSSDFGLGVRFHYLDSFVFLNL